MDNDGTIDFKVILELMSSNWLSYGCPFGEPHFFLGVPACAHCNGGKLSRYEAASDFQVSTLVHTGQGGTYWSKWLQWSKWSDWSGINGFAGSLMPIRMA